MREPGKNYALWDLDGCILGGKGYIAREQHQHAPTRILLPCLHRPGWGQRLLGAAARATELCRYSATVLLSCNT